MTPETLREGIERESRARINRSRPLPLEEVFNRAQWAAEPSRSRKPALLAWSVIGAIALVAGAAIAVAQLDREDSTGIATSTKSEVGDSRRGYTVQVEFDDARRALSVTYRSALEAASSEKSSGSTTLPTYIFARSLSDATSPRWNISTYTSEVTSGDFVHTPGPPVVSLGEVRTINADLGDLPAGTYRLSDGESLDQVVVLSPR